MRMVERECLAIKLVIKSFEVHLLGKELALQIDDYALEWLEKLKESNSELCCWGLASKQINLV